MVDWSDVLNSIFWIEFNPETMALIAILVVADLKKGTITMFPIVSSCTRHVGPKLVGMLRGSICLRHDVL
jgi:hypothetical protein